jgi:putative phosphoribosyl transferase
LLTTEEQESDLKTQRILDKYPGIVLNKFNIQLLTTRLKTITYWLIDSISEVKDLPIGYFGSSTGAAAVIEASVYNSLLDKIYAIVSRGGRPDLAATESIQNVKAHTMLIVGSKDSKAVIDLNKKVSKELRNAISKELVMIPNAGHLFEEDGAIEQVSGIAAKWFTLHLNQK